MNRILLDITYFFNVMDLIGLGIWVALMIGVMGYFGYRRLRYGEWD